MDRTEIAYQLIDVTAKQDASLSTSDKMAFSDLNALKGDIITTPNNGTLEQNLFILDGERAVFPDNPSTDSWGLWSTSISNQNGVVTGGISLTIQFTQNHSSVGIELFFDDSTGDYCNNLEITFYDYLNNVLLSKTYNPTSTQFFCNGQVNDYRKIVITFNGTSKPYRRVKLRGIVFGGTKIFGDGSLVSATMLEEVDPISAELSINTLDFSVHTEDFELLDPQGLYTLLQKRQPLDVTHYTDNGAVQMGRYYLDSPECDSNDITSMQCIDFIGVMDTTEFMGGIYSNVLVSSIVSAIMTSAGGEYELDSSFSSVRRSGYIPICTHREALRQVAFSIGAIVDTSRDGIVKIYPRPASVTARISHEQKINNHKVKQSQLVTGVEIVAHNYVVGASSEQIYQSQLSAGTYTIRFGAPYTNLGITGATITHSDINYATISVSSTQTVTLTGKKYNDSTSVFGYYAPNPPANAEANTIKIEDCTLVSTLDALQIAQSIYDYMQMRYTTEGGLILNDESVGILASIESINSKSLQGIIESLETDLVGGYLSQMKLKGGVDV